MSPMKKTNGSIAINFSPKLVVLKANTVSMDPKVNFVKFPNLSGPDQICKTIITINPSHGPRAFVKYKATRKMQKIRLQRFF